MLNNISHLFQIRICELYVYSQVGQEEFFKVYSLLDLEFLSVYRGEPTESIDGNSHRNKTILFWSNCIKCLHREYMVFPLKDNFFIENGLLD